MTKQEFVDAVARRSGLSRREAGQAVDAVLDTISEALKRRDSVAFTGFGKFTTSARKERMGVNPRNPSQKVHIPAATVPKFTPGSALKQAVRARTLGAHSEGEHESARTVGAGSEGEHDEEWEPPVQETS